MLAAQDLAPVLVLRNVGRRREIANAQALRRLVVSYPTAIMKAIAGWLGNRAAESATGGGNESARRTIGRSFESGIARDSCQQEENEEQTP